MNKSFVLLMISLISLVSCKREDPNPELRDPIYLDLISESSKQMAALDALNKKLEDANKDLNKTKARTMERKNSENEIRKIEYQIGRVKELVDYYEIRSKRRKYEAVKSYLAAFEKNELWPDPKEYEAYLINKRLNAASRNWSERVPKPSHLLSEKDIAAKLAAEAKANSAKSDGEGGGEGAPAGH